MYTCIQSLKFMICFYNTVYIVYIGDKKIKTIRINEKLVEYLVDVPKAISYANWLLDKIERIYAHEKNAVCWIVSISNISPNRMSIGDRNGKSPIFDETISIVSEVPRTNLSQEKRENGWLGQTNDYSSYAHGGFASIDSARAYIIDYMGGKLISEEYLPDYDNRELYTTAKYEQYYFVEDWIKNNVPDVEGLSDEQVEKLAKQLESEANKDGYNILGDIAEYLRDLRD